MMTTTTMANMNSILSAAFIVLFLLAAGSIVYSSWRNGISPMPTSPAVRRQVVAELRRIPEARVMIEAGSGWGTLALEAARSRPDLQVIGIENSPLPWAVSRCLARWGSFRNVMFHKTDLYTYPYGEADVVVCYLYPGAMTRLDEIFRQGVKPGAVMISICFALPGWTPERVITCGDMYRTKIYVYRSLNY